MNEGSYKGLRIISMALLMTVMAAFNPRPFTEEDEGVNIIVIDPGHGGKDPGNLGTGRYKDKEKDVSYDVSVLVKQFIEQYLPYTKAILTRNDNQFIELYQRAVIANRANADLFISIHCNANDARSAYGTESFVLGMGERDQRLNKTAQLENSARLLEDNWESNYESLDASNPAEIIALRAYKDAFLEQSISIADEIQNPKRTIPFSLFSSTLFVMILYVLINTVILLTVPMENLKGALEVAFLSADVIFGVIGSQFMSILLAITLISSASSMVWTGPRVTQEMSKKIRSLRIFCSYKDNRPPLKGLCLQLLITLIMLFTSSFKQILTYIGFIVTLFSFLAVLGVFIYRYRFGKIKESCTTFAYPITPLIFLFGSGWMMFYLCLYETKETLLGVLTLCIGGVFYFFSQRNRKLK